MRLALSALLLLVLIAVAADVLAEHVFGARETDLDLLRSYAGPNASIPAYWLGADELGRSEIVRLIYGARVSLLVATAAAFLDVLIGVPVGLAAALRRGWFDVGLQWFVTTLNGVPRLFLLLLISTLFGPGPLALIAILALLSWPQIGLFVRGQSLSLREREFVIAARALGASSGRIIASHLAPNVLPLVVVLASIDVGSLILTESALSFLGLGIQPPNASWGNLLASAATNLERAPWLVWGPGIFIFATVLALYILSDAIRDALDPRLSRR